MAKLTWADIGKGDVVELAGKAWTVEKAKRLGGGSIRVVVRSGSHTAGSEVRAKAKVKRLSRRTEIVERKPKLHDERGAQQRWAKKRELDKRLGHRTTLEPGDPKATEPPAAPGADVWDRPQDRIERKLDAILGARLVGEATDERSGYYVPPVDVTTVASHMAIYHPNTYDPAKDEATMLAGHAHVHGLVARGELKLDVNHWHTETRPEAVA